MAIGLVAATSPSALVCGCSRPGRPGDSSPPSSSGSGSASARSRSSVRPACTTWSRSTLGLVGSLVLGVAAAIVAIRIDSRTVGVVRAAGGPRGAAAARRAPGAVTFALIGTTLVGTTIIALQRSWRWFPVLAFVLSVSPARSWIVRRRAGRGRASSRSARSGSSMRSRPAARSSSGPTNRLRDTSATLLVADATFLVWAGVVLLDGPTRALASPVPPRRRPRSCGVRRGVHLAAG